MRGIELLDSILDSLELFDQLHLAAFQLHQFIFGRDWHLALRKYRNIVTVLIQITSSRKLSQDFWLKTK